MKMIISFWIGVGLLAYTYFGYFIILLIITRFVTKNVPAKLSAITEELSVGILIAAHNEENVISSRIQNCLNLDYPRELLEVWIASDGSTDKTNETVKTYSERDSRIHLITFPRMGKSKVLSRSLSKLNTDIVVFSDANTKFSSNTLKNLIKHFDNKKIGCVCGKLIYKNPANIVSGKGEGLYWRYETLLKKLESKLGYVAGANGAIYAARRELLEALPEGTINDDFVISMRIIQKGFKCIYEEGAIAYEDVATSIKGEFNRHVRDAAGHYIAMLHLLKLLNPFLGTRSFIYWSHRVIRWIAPFLIICIFILNLCLLKFTIYKITFVLQLFIYILAILGFCIHKQKKIPLIVYVPFYFLNLNLALFIGFLKAVLGRQSIMWERTERV